MRLVGKSSLKQGAPKRLVLGAAALASAAVVGVAGLAGATANKPSKQQCASAGFTNYGQCVREWAHDKNKPGNGYGGGNNVNTEVNTEVNADIEGDNNVVSIAVNTMINVFTQ